MKLSGETIVVGYAACERISVMSLHDLQLLVLVA